MMVPVNNIIYCFQTDFEFIGQVQFYMLFYVSFFLDTLQILMFYQIPDNVPLF